MIPRRSLFLLCALLLPNGCAKEPRGDKIPAPANSALDNATEIEVLSLDGNPRDRVDGGFHGWKVLGQTTIKEAAVRDKLVSALKRGVDENRGTVAACFNPRHGLRILHDGQTFDFVICFECYQAEVWTHDKREGFLVSRSPQPAFDEVLTGAGVPLGEKPGN